MHAVVQNVECEATADDSIRNGRWEQEMCQLCEWERKEEEERWRHNQTQAVHRKIMMDSVTQEVQGKCKRVVREPVIDVEEEPMHRVFEEGPDKVSNEEANQRLPK